MSINFLKGIGVITNNLNRMEKEIARHFCTGNITHPPKKFIVQNYMLADYQCSTCDTITGNEQLERIGSYSNGDREM